MQCIYLDSGFHTRSLRCQRQPKTRERASDGQPENLVGEFVKFETAFKHFGSEPQPGSIGDWGGLGGIGWLVGRHRQQAGSYSWIGWVSGKGWSAGRPSSLASQLPQGLRWSGRNWSAVRSSSPAGWLLQLDRVVSGRGWSAGRPSSLASQLPQGLRWSGRNWSAVRSSSPAGWLLQLDRVVSGRGWSAGRPSSLASQLPQGLRWSGRNWLVGRPSSPAGWLPQGIEVVREGLVGCQAAIAHVSKAECQLASLLILICRPLRKAERRGSSGGGRAAPFGAAKHIGRRCSEANRSRCPRMNPGAKEPRASARGRTPGPSLFGYFFLGRHSGRLKKVTRRKGGTASRHTRRNG